MKRAVITYSVILLASLLLEWWLSYYSFPENIPHTSIRISGLLLTALLLTILIFFQKQLLRTDPETTILLLTLSGTLVVFLAETTFQLLRQPAIHTDILTERVYLFARSTIGITLFGAVFSFLIAFQLKTKKTGLLIVLIISIILLFNVLKYFLE